LSGYKLFAFGTLIVSGGLRVKIDLSFLKKDRIEQIPISLRET